MIYMIDLGYVRALKFCVFISGKIDESKKFFVFIFVF